MMRFTYVLRGETDTAFPIYICGYVPIAILTTYDVIYDEIKRDILTEQFAYWNSFLKNIRISFHSLYISLGFEKHRPDLELDLKKLKFDIDLTEPFYLHQLIENVI